MRLPHYAPIDSTPGGPGVVTPAMVIEEARSWIDTPYEHQHRVKGHAVDCVGLIIGVARELGLVAPDFDVNAYPRKPDGKTLLAECARFMTPIADEDIKPGHILVLEYRRDPQHMGVLADYMHGGFSLIHAYGSVDGKGRVEEWNMAYKRRAFRPIKAFALPGVR